MVSVPIEAVYRPRVRKNRGSILERRDRYMAAYSDHMAGMKNPDVRQKHGISQDVLRNIIRHRGLWPRLTREGNWLIEQDKIPARYKPQHYKRTKYAPPAYLRPVLYANACPRCKGSVQYQPHALNCIQCGWEYTGKGAPHHDNDSRFY